MENLKMGCLVPHPPIVVPEVGGDEVERISSTVLAFEKLAADIEMAAPETMVIISPHSPIYTDGFAIKGGDPLSGSLSMFRAPEVNIKSKPDSELSEAICRIALSRGVPTTVISSPGSSGDELDHGILVPLYYVYKKEYKLVCITISMMEYRSHYILGKAIREAVEQTGRRTVFIASGDLSHRLIRGAPAGYDPDGEVFDHKIFEIMDSADFKKLFDLDGSLVSNAGECGLRSIFTMAGVFDGHKVDSRVLSYEGPFGVGYMVAEVRSVGLDASRSIL